MSNTARDIVKFSVGDRVTLPANKSEGWDEEHVVITAVTAKDWYLVEVDDQIEDYEEDDRVREVHGQLMVPQVKSTEINK